MQFEPISLGSGFGVRLNIDDLDIPKNEKESLEPYLTFNVKTYKVLSAEGDNAERFREVEGAANWYLEHADNESKLAIAQFFALSRQKIRAEMPMLLETPAKLTEFIIGIGEMYLAIVERCHLMEEFHAYARTFVQLQDISGYGSRPQDSKELTFSVEEMEQLMNLAFLIKMVAPLFGELILNIPDKFDDEGNKIPTQPKDIKVVGFLDPLIHAYFTKLMDKVDFFIMHIINNQCKPNNNAAAVFSGLIPETRLIWARSAILVRNFVCCKLERLDSNIVRFVDTMVHSHITSQNNFANRNQVRPRKPVAAFGFGEDSDSTAQMETDSIISNRPLDSQIIVEAAVPRVIDDFLVQYQITHAELNECFDWLMDHPVMPTPLNSFLACAVFGKKLGGGRSIELLQRQSFTKLICLLQIIAFQLGLLEFGHMLTATKSITTRVMQTQNEVQFELNYSTSYAYRTCRDRFGGSSRASDGKEWDKQMKDICDDIAQNKYLYNTPPAIMDQIQDDSIRNGAVIPVELEIISEACTMINDMSNS